MVSKSFLIKPLAAAALLAVAGASHAALTVYNTQASFLAAVSAPGVDTFNDMPLTSVPSPIGRTAGAYTYSGAVSTTSFFTAGTTADVWLSTNTATDSIIFSSFTSTVRGIGGLFFGSDINGAYLLGDLTLVAVDSAGATSTQTITGATTASFLGFVSSVPLTSLTVTGVQPVTGFLWPTVNNLTLGAAVVPEPQTYALMLAGLGFMGFVARRRRG